MVSYFAIYAIVKFRLKEFFTEYNYTILSPLIYNFLFIIIFSTIDRYYSLSINNISFIEFLIPGLILIIVAQESFDSSSASIINSKQIVFYALTDQVFDLKLTNGVLIHFTTEELIAVTTVVLGKIHSRVGVFQ